ncbi:hypothetical protein GGR53DRAFT_492537 [Hypoxylon sp. FL1150]|nr:hypothetical protein GGR53DRAFT_492537 [Hypoxylon sp. FL1150]
MASDTPKRRPKSGALPGKFRTFVSDMKKFKIHRRDRRKHDDESESERVMTDPVFVPPAPQPPETRTVSAPNSLFVGNLAVQVTVTFDEPLSYSYKRTYEASPSLQPTETLCQGLLRRIDHCCYEMITRKDATAMEYAAASGPDKPLRFEIQIDIIRGWSEIWASRTFKSYQKQPLTPEAASQIILSTHYIVGLFLRRHDDGFVWKGGPVRDDPSQEIGKFPHRAGRVQSMSCVPRFYFLERPQTFESIPGYSVNFCFASRCQRRKLPDWNTTVEVNSHQTAPLNSIGAESLFFEASYALEGALRAERHAFEAVHRLCASVDGCKNCRHHDNDGLELKVSIQNNLGPQFPDLERTIHCSSNLSFHSDVQNCVSFVKRVESALSRTRDDADDTISRMNDLEFRITELRGRGWSLDEPLIFVLGPYKSFSQRTVTAMLDRIQAGVAEVLRNNAVSVRMTAHKRGHFILDKTLVAREPLDLAGNSKAKSARKSKAYVIDRLRQRIERDIQMVCKDTLALDDIEREIRASEREACVKSPASRDGDADEGADVVTSSTSEFEVSESASNDTMDQRDDSTYPSTNADTSLAASISKSATDDENPACEIPDSEAPETEELTTSSDTRPEPVRRTSDAIHCSNTGSRAFPLVPGLDDYTDPDSSSQEETSSGSNSREVIPNPPATNNLPTQSSRPSTPIDTEGSQGQAPESTANLGEGAQSAPTYEASIASSTPSLMFSGGSSPSSSLLITPKTHRLSTEADYPKNSIIDSDDEDNEDSESINSESRQDVSKLPPFPSPKLRHAAKQIPSSPLRVSQTVQEQSSFVSIQESGGAPLHDRTETSSIVVEPRLSSTGLGIVEKSPTPETKAGSELEVEKDQNLGGPVNDDSEAEKEIANPSLEIDDEVGLPVHVDKPIHVQQSAGGDDETDDPGDAVDDFSQSKPDFIFSSPLATTPDGSVIEEFVTPTTPTTPTRLREASPSPFEDGDISPVPSPRTQRILQSHRRSFGSAGMLGFHEQMFGSVTLRTALMRSRPTNEFGSDSRPASPKRPGTAM